MKHSGIWATCKGETGTSRDFTVRLAKGIAARTRNSGDPVVVKIARLLDWIGDNPGDPRLEEMLALVERYDYDAALQLAGGAP